LQLAAVVVFVTILTYVSAWNGPRLNEIARIYPVVYSSIGIAAAAASLIFLMSQPLLKDKDALNMLAFVNYKAALDNFFAAPTPIEETYFAGGFDANGFLEPCLHPDAGNCLAQLKNRLQNLAKYTLTPENASHAALISLASNDYSLAQKFIKDSIAREPYNPILYITQGLINYEQGFYKESLDSFRTAAVHISSSQKAQLKAAVDADNALAQWNIDLGYERIKWFQSPKEALGRLQRAKDYYKQIDYPQGEAECDLLRAQALIDLGDFQNAAEPIQIAESKFQQIKSMQGLGQVKNLLGQLRFKEASYEFRRHGNSANFRTKLIESETLFEQAAFVFKNMGYDRGIGDVAKNLCAFNTTIAQNQQELSEIEPQCREAIAIYREIGYQKGEADARGNLGNLYRNEGKLDDALDELNEAFTIDRKIGFKLGIARQHANIGRVYIKKGSPREAFANLDESRRELEDIDAEYDLTFVNDLLECVRDNYDSQTIRACNNVLNKR